MKSKKLIITGCLFLLAANVLSGLISLDIYRKHLVDLKTISALKAENEQLTQKDVDHNEQLLKQAGNDDAKLAMARVSGIYGFEDRARGLPTQKLDLRSNGSGISSKFFGASEVDKKGINWTLKGGTLTTDDQKFQVEGDDLVDARGNRWIRVRY